MDEEKKEPELVELPDYAPGEYVQECLRISEKHGHTIHHWWGYQGLIVAKRDEKGKWHFYTEAHSGEN
jgi:hypothetical protein